MREIVSQLTFHNSNVFTEKCSENNCEFHGVSMVHLRQEIAGNATCIHFRLGGRRQFGGLAAKPGPEDLPP